MLHSMRMSLTTTEQEWDWLIDMTFAAQSQNKHIMTH